MRPVVRRRDRTLAAALCGLLGHGQLLFGLHVAAESFALGLPADAIGLLVLDARGVTLDTDPEIDAEVECFFVRESELTSELVDPDLFPRRQELPQSLPLGAASTAAPSSILARSDAIARSASISTAAIGPRRARSRPDRRSARSTQASRKAPEAGSRQIQAPRPGSLRPMRRLPSGSRTVRTRAAAGERCRQPTQVLTGPAWSRPTCAVTVGPPRRGRPLRPSPGPRPPDRLAPGRRAPGRRAPGRHPTRIQRRRPRGRPKHGR